MGYKVKVLKPLQHNLEEASRKILFFTTASGDLEIEELNLAEFKKQKEGQRKTAELEKKRKIALREAQREAIRFINGHWQDVRIKKSSKDEILDEGDKD